MSPPPPTQPCPSCGGVATYIEQHNHYSCSFCSTTFPGPTPAPGFDYEAQVLGRSSGVRQMTPTEEKMLGSAMAHLDSTGTIPDGPNAQAMMKAESDRAEGAGRDSEPAEKKPKKEKREKKSRKEKKSRRHHHSDESKEAGPHQSAPAELEDEEKLPPDDESEGIEPALQSDRQRLPWKPHPESTAVVLGLLSYLVLFAVWSREGNSVRSFIGSATFYLFPALLALGCYGVLRLRRRLEDVGQQILDHDLIFDGSEVEEDVIRKADEYNDWWESFTANLNWTQDRYLFMFSITGVGLLIFVLWNFRTLFDPAGETLAESLGAPTFWTLVLVCVAGSFLFLTYWLWILFTSYVWLFGFTTANDVDRATQAVLNPPSRGVDLLFRSIGRLFIVRKLPLAACGSREDSAQRARREVAEQMDLDDATLGADSLLLGWRFAGLLSGGPPFRNFTYLRIFPKPLHPDEWGGLEPLVRLVNWTWIVSFSTAVIVLLAFYPVLQPVPNGPFLVALVLIAVLILITYLPGHSIFQMRRQVVQSFMEEISDRIDTEMERMMEEGEGWSAGLFQRFNLFMQAHMAARDAYVKFRGSLIDKPGAIRLGVSFGLFVIVYLVERGILLI